MKGCPPTAMNGDRDGGEQNGVYYGRAGGFWETEEGDTQYKQLVPDAAPCLAFSVDLC